MGQRLSHLMQGYPMINLLGTLERNIEAVFYDSRKVGPQGLFVAMPGVRHDGSQFIKEALHRQAAAYITEAPVDQLLELNAGLQDATAIIVEDSRHALAWVAARFYGHPSRQMSLVGITGTNGKTTLTYLLESIFNEAGNRSGVIGSINYRYPGNTASAPMTTPEALDINRLLTEMLAHDTAHCFMEVSSHALALKRVRELSFTVAVFTNLTRDHLDYHKSFEHYKASKKELFKDCAVKKQVINTDDPVGREIVQETTRSTLTTGIDQPADVRAENCRVSVDGIRFTLKTPNGTVAIQSSLLGRHNIYNLLSASAVALSEGLSLEVIAQGLRALSSVPGRFEKIQLGQDFTVAVDYAHTDDALSNVLRAAREIARNRVIVVFGCGGDRDPGKRPLMGRVALELSDLAIITSDNPRTEDPDQIIGQICAGFPAGVQLEKDYILRPQRREAIEFAVNHAQAGDLVLIAGKGHETYQILNTGTIAFDDREVAAEALKKKLSLNGK